MSAVTEAQSMPARPQRALLKQRRLADRFHVCKNLSEAVQRCLSRVLSEMKGAREASGGKDVNFEEETPVPGEEWRPAKGPQVTRAIAIHRVERDARYQQAECLRKPCLSTKEIAGRLGIHERTVRHWFRRGVAPDSRPRRKRQSDFDPYAAYVLKRWRDGERNGARLWQEITAASATQARSAWSIAFSRPSKQQR